jgi:hypothetical protein
MTNAQRTSWSLDIGAWSFFTTNHSPLTTHGLLLQ